MINDIKIIMDIENQLVNLRKILNLSNEKIQELKNDALIIAQNLGVTCSGVLYTLTDSAINGGKEGLDKKIVELKSR